MTTKYENDLHNATPERLAELLEQYALTITRELESIPLSMRASFDNAEVLKEAACRLRESAKPVYNANKSNDEEFEIF